MITITTVNTDCTGQEVREVVGRLEHGEYNKVRDFCKACRLKDKQASRFHEYLEVRYVFNFDDV